MKDRTIILVTMLPLWSMNNGWGGKALFNTVDMLSKSDYNFYLITNQKNDYSKLNINQKNVVYIDTEWYFDKIKNNKANKITTLKYYATFKKLIIKELKKIIDSNKNKDIIIYAYEVQTILGCRKIATKYNLPLITRFQGTIMSQYEDKLKYSSFNCDIGFRLYKKCFISLDNLVLLKNDLLSDFIVIEHSSPLEL